MSVRNTKIRQSYFNGGIRLPHESPSVGDGYATSGECITRQMTEAERQRYGVIEKKEADEVSRLDIARGKLTKEVYLAAKQAGRTDIEIMEYYFGFDSWGDVLAAIKREWKFTLEEKAIMNSLKKGLIKMALESEPTLQEKMEQAATDYSKTIVLDTTPLTEEQKESFAEKIIEGMRDQRRLPVKVDIASDATSKFDKSRSEPTVQEIAKQAVSEVLMESAEKFAKDMEQEFINGSPCSDKEPVGIFNATRQVSVMELLVEVEMLKGRMDIAQRRLDEDQARIDYLSALFERTMVEVKQ